MKKYSVLALLLFIMSSCKTQLDNTLTEQEMEQGWKLLFDGQSLSGWHLYNQIEKPSAWVVADGTIIYQADSTNVEHEDLVTDQEFENFDFTFDWKISEEGNSGVFINVVEVKENPTAWATGPEYQLLDASHPDYANNPKKRTGCIFNINEQLNAAETKPAGQWNQSRILQNHGVVRFYLNGVLTSEQDFSSDDWKEKINNSNFKTFPNYGRSIKGKIGLQKWYKRVSFKNLKIKELE